MTRKTKIILIILGAIFVAGAIGVTIYYLTSKNNQDEEGMEDKDLNPFVEPTSPRVTSPSGTTNVPTNTTTTTNSNQVKPRYDSEGQISNPFSEVKDRMLYPKREWAGGWGYANVRSSPEVNTNQGWWDGYDNLITTIGERTPIGKAKEVQTKLLNGFPYKWYKVKLYKPVDGWFSDYTEGYVRADTVTFVPYD